MFQMTFTEIAHHVIYVAVVKEKGYLLLLRGQVATLVTKHSDADNKSDGASE
jgi:hypothetical protein